MTCGRGCFAGTESGKELCCVGTVAKAGHGSVSCVGVGSADSVKIMSPESRLVSVPVESAGYDGAFFADPNALTQMHCHALLGGGVSPFLWRRSACAHRKKEDGWGARPEASARPSCLGRPSLRTFRAH